MGDKREKDRPKLNSKIIAPPVDESHARDASDSRKRRRSSSPVPRGERNDFLRRDNFNRDGFRMNEPRRFVERRPNENNSFSNRGRDRNFSRDNNRYYRGDDNIDDSNNNSNNNNDNRSGNTNLPHPADRMMGRSWRNSDNRDNRGDFRDNRDNRDNRDTRGGFARGFSRGGNFNGGGRFHRGTPFRGNSGNGSFNRRGGRGGNTGSGGFDPEDDPTAFDYIVPRGKSYFQHDDRIESDEDESHMSKRGRLNDHWQPRNRNRNNTRGDRWSHDKFEEFDTTENTKTDSASNNNGHAEQNIETSGIADDTSLLEDMDHRHRDRNGDGGDSGNEEYSENRQQQNEEQKDQQQLLQKEHGHSNEGLVVDYEDEDRDRNHENIEDN